MMTDGDIGCKIWVRGIVQGVGFRPFVYTQAVTHQLTGWVRNTSSGVEIEITGRPAGVQSFLSALKDNPPPLAQIDSVVTEPIPPAAGSGFLILESHPEPGAFLPISPDMSICPDCQRELFDPADRRYRYPFLNCTHCGPRFSIIRDIPYDRPFTSMAGFPMCPDCLREYHDPLDRRFHAQPVACPACGPQVWLQTANGTRLAERDEAVHLARKMLKEGAILAVKGLGGYNLACDAANPQAVAELRRRKKRSDKPFALMAFDTAAVARHCQLDSAAEALLTAPQRPILLLNRLPDASVAPQVAPGQVTLGVMLAYTPLHLLLLEPEPGYPDLWVMTSGNLSEEPIAYVDGEAQERLSPMADAFLLHDRPIHMRVDDSVFALADGQSYPIRRARGYAPDPIRLSGPALPPIFAAGAELKNTFCLTQDRYAFLSHHIGDLENYETLRSYEDGVAHYERLFRVQPQTLVCDLHPDYLSTRYAQQRAAESGLPLLQVQHHHAHLAACLADNDWLDPDPVIGLSFDGTGLGPDGAIWGGEFLLGHYASFQRLYHLAYTPLPGGDQAVRKPARMALAHLWQAGLDWEPDLPPVQALCYEERTLIRIQLEKSINAPLTSSAGRLFDAAAALIGVRAEATYEGQAAIELEALADPQEARCYEFDLRGTQIDPAPLWQALLADWRAGTAAPIISARFHNSLAALSVQVCQAVRQQSGARTVALSGGVWQNRTLLTKTLSGLRSAGFTVLIHRRVPANDGGIALGQALIAAHSRNETVSSP